MARIILMILLLAGAFGPSTAQSLSFSRPETLFPAAVSDKAVALAGFQEQYTVAWKEPGPAGHIYTATIAKAENFRVEMKPQRMERAVSLTAPVLQVIEDQLYLFWVGTDSNIHYLIHDPEAGFSGAAVHTLLLDKPARFTLGLSTVYSDSLLMIGTHSEKKNRLLFVTCRPDSSGVLTQGHVAFVRHARSDAFPAIALTNAGGAIRLSWADHRTRQLYFCDYEPGSKVWQLPQNYTGVLTERTPAIVVGGTMEGYLTLMGRGKDNHLWYDMIKEDETEVSAQVLPDYFAAAFRPALAADTSGLVMAYAGTDKRIYFSFARRYDPANWMGDLLFPEKENYSLKDIVLPGAHDAGMSVLNGVGGQGAVIINECNTLTQVMNIERQLEAGIRMFDLRIDRYSGELFTKHAPSDCMEDAIGGGYGEKLSEILKKVKQFLSDHNQETVVLSFCHFCERDMSLREQAEKISGMLGTDMILFADNARKVGDVKLRDLAGKAVLTFESHDFTEWGIEANTMINETSDAYLNYRRCYAATNQLPLLLSAQYLFFKGLTGNVHNNDLVRLDWQLTEDSKEAIFICNDFESEKANPLLSGTILLANAIKKSKSIIELGTMGNRHLPGKVMEWIDEGVITKENKPNILYVDVAGNWITDFCIYLNQHPVYQK